MSKDSSSPTVWTIREILAWTTNYFETKGVESPKFEADILLAFLLEKDRIELYLELDKPLTSTERTTYRELIKRRGAGEPLAYITGKKSFYSITLACDSRALIPRPETELLVSVVLNRMPSFAKTIIDVGTGTGAVGLSIADQNTNVNVILTDISKDALELARHNRDTLGFDKRVGLVCGDLLDCIAPNRTFEVCVSNPPYISERTLDLVQPEVLQYEPSLALYGGGHDGLDIISRLAQQAYRRLPEDGLFAIEIGLDQGEEVRTLLHTLGFHHIELKTDLANLPRVASCLR